MRLHTSYEPDGEPGFPRRPMIATHNATSSIIRIGSVSRTARRPACTYYQRCHARTPSHEASVSSNHLAHEKYARAISQKPKGSLVHHRNRGPVKATSAITCIYCIIIHPHTLIHIFTHRLNITHHLAPHISQRSIQRPPHALPPSASHHKPIVHPPPPPPPPPRAHPNRSLHSLDPGHFTNSYLALHPLLHPFHKSSKHEYKYPSIRYEATKQAR